MTTGMLTSQGLIVAVDRRLAEGRRDDALHLLRTFKAESLEMRNAYGVGLMRAGEFNTAIDVFRSLVLDSSGVCVKPDVPDTVLVNYATALLLARNVTGCVEALKDVRVQNHAGVIRLLSAINEWKKQMSWWRRAWLRLSGVSPSITVVLGYAPGELIAEQAHETGGIGRDCDFPHACRSNAGCQPAQEARGHYPPRSRSRACRFWKRSALIGDHLEPSAGSPRRISARCRGLRRLRYAWASWRTMSSAFCTCAFARNCDEKT